MPPKEKPATTAAAATNNAAEIDNKKPAGNPKRQKIVKACKDCRRRKVKCDGATPCGTCRRSSIQCIFESTTPKRGTSKHYIESLENRLSVMEKAMNSLSGPTAQLVKEAVRRQEEQLQLQQQLQQVAQDTTTSSSPVLNQQQQPEFNHPEDRYMMNEFGSPSYIQDISFMDSNNNMNMNTYRGGYYTQDSSQSTTSSSSPKSVSSQNSMTRYSNMDEIEIQNHLKFYLIQIQPYFPLFVPSFFNRQYAAQELPKILIYAMCALSCIFQQLEEHHSYYQRATIMLDEAIGKPSIALVQTLLLLVKYKEYHCEQYFEKTKSLMARTIEVCKILNLHGLNTKALDPMTETRKRTFCMVFTYNTLLCVEQGVMNDLLLSTITQDHLPVTVADESTVDCQRYIIQFCCTLDQIHRHMSRISQRQEIQKELRDEQQIIEENLALFQLQVKIENDLLHLPSNLTMNNQQQQLHKHQPSFPAEDIVMTVSPMTRLLHMLYHLNVILLHFHYAKYPLPHLPQGDLPVYPHGIMCASSASHMIRLVEGLVSDPSQSYRYAPRGLQFVAHCMTSALTVLQFETSIKSNSKVYMEEYQRCAVLTQQIATASPSNEMRSYSRELDLSSLDVSSLKVSSSTTPSTSPSPILNYPMVASPISTESVPLPVPKMRRNTISHRPQQPPQQPQQQMVPPALLQLSSTGVSQQFTSMQQQQQQQHHPLHNIHATPLQMQQQHMQMQSSPVPQLLRGSTQSCNDLRSMNRLHKVSPPPPPPLATQFTSNSFTQHRKPVGSVISSSTASSTQQGPYRGTGIRNVSPSLPYGTPTMTQSSGFPRQQIQQPGKMKRIKKSVSIHGISSTYRQQQQQQQQYQLFQQQQQQHQQFQFQQQLNNLLGGNSMLHRPYQPTFDDQKYITDDDFAMNVDDLNFLSNYPTLDDGQRSEGHLL